MEHVTVMKEFEWMFPNVFYQKWYAILSCFTWIFGNQSSSCSCSTKFSCSL